MGVHRVHHVTLAVDDDGIEWEVDASDPPPATPFDTLRVDSVTSDD